MRRLKTRLEAIEQQRDEALTQELECLLHTLWAYQPDGPWAVYKCLKEVGGEAAADAICHELGGELWRGIVAKAEAMPCGV